MNNTFEPDFRNVYEKANEILMCSSVIRTFPFAIDKVIEEETDIEIVGFNEIRKMGANPEEILGSKDGILQEQNGRYIMFINEEMPECRKIFTKGHECGHYFLCHDLKKLNYYKLKDLEKFNKLYSKYEVETNMFAAQLFMPEQVLIELSKRGCHITVDFLTKTFAVSKEAAERRIKLFQKVYEWDSSRKYKNTYALSYDDLILQKFKSFIDKHSPRKNTYEYDLERELELERERQSWY